MTDDLHDVLDRTADLAGPVHFDAEALWRQGNRTKHLHAAMTAVGVLAVLALVSLSVWWGTGPTTPHPAAPASTGVTPAIPSTLYDPPTDLPIAGDLRIGVTAAVFMPAVHSGVVAVSAVDGSYRRLTLPGFDEMRSRIPPVIPAVAVSPDGTKLAYPWHAKLPDVSGPHVASGIRIADLRSGSVSTYPVGGGRAALCGGMAWSPNSRYLVSSCELEDAIDVHTSNGRTGEILRFALSARTETVVPEARWLASLATVNDSGQVAVVDGASIDVWTLRAQARVRQVPVAVSSSDASVAWLGPSGDLVVFMGQWRNGRAHGIGTQVLPASGSAEPFRHVQGMTGWMLGPVGAARAAMWVVGSRDGEVYLQSESGGPVRAVHFEGTTPDSAFSIATRLLARPTREMPNPNAVSTGNHIRKALPYVTVGLVLVAVMVVVVVRRRERMRRQV